jgi:hypothetical protein
VVAEVARGTIRSRRHAFPLRRKVRSPLSASLERGRTLAKCVVLLSRSFRATKGTSNSPHHFALTTRCSGLVCGLEAVIRNLLLEAAILFCFGGRSAAHSSISRKGYDTGAVSKSVLSLFHDHRGTTTVEAEERKRGVSFARGAMSFSLRQKISRPLQHPLKEVLRLARKVVLHRAPSGPPKVSTNSSRNLSVGRCRKYRDLE